VTLVEKGNIKASNISCKCKIIGLNIYERCYVNTAMDIIIFIQWATFIA